MKSEKGFTLIELLVVIAIIGILSTIVLFSINTARARARDSARISNVKQVQNALEMYYSENGSYPISAGGNWAGSGADYGTLGITGVNGYIPNLAPTYIAELPVDPKQTASKGYIYKSDGFDYFFMAHGTAEGNVPTSFQRPSAPTSSDIAVYTPGFADSTIVDAGEEGTIPAVTTPTATDITHFTAVLGANITSLGIPASILSRGVCLGTSANPTTNCSPEGGVSTGTFTYARNGLTPTTTYHYRGYATNATGTGYSPDAIFITTGDFSAP
jgi:prepilin-type N-terminal cleavage/methylation domain-containing protein